MIRIILHAVALTIAIAVPALADNGHASRHDEAERASRGAETGEFVPLARIIAALREQYHGEIVETEFETEHGSPYYEFHILQDDGHVIEIKVDARSGSYIKAQSDDD